MISLTSDDRDRGDDEMACCGFVLALSHCFRPSHECSELFDDTASRAVEVTGAHPVTSFLGIDPKIFSSGLEGLRTHKNAYKRVWQRHDGLLRPRGEQASDEVEVRRCCPLLVIL
jgi:hypothetical protein